MWLLYASWPAVSGRDCSAVHSRRRYGNFVADAIGSNEGQETSDQIALRRLLALLKQLTINVSRPM